jgi:nucleoside-diphosphate-sugar epimerase
MTVLITGANGFVGSALREKFEKDGVSGRCAIRAQKSGRGLAKEIVIGGLSLETDWPTALLNVEGVVHLAGRVHIMNRRSSGLLVEFARVNVEGTANLVRQAAAAGARRFIFLSSVKLNGEFTEAWRSFTVDDLTGPEDPYGISKDEAEELLREITSETNMELVIIRSPLAYGFGVKAKFRSMIHWLSRSILIPLVAVTENQRSLAALNNLVDLIGTCLNHPAAANQTVVVSDGEDLSIAVCRC